MNRPLRIIGPELLAKIDDQADELENRAGHAEFRWEMFRAKGLTLDIDWPIGLGGIWNAAHDDHTADERK